MFSINSIDNIFRQLKDRYTIIGKTDKVEHLPSEYITYVTTKQGEAVTADVNLYGYEKALSLNAEITREYPQIAKQVWLIGDNNGDEWFINFHTGHVMLYNHDLGEYSNLEDFLDLEIGFEQFLQLSFLLKQLNDLFDEDIQPSPEMEKTFVNVVNSISQGLFEKLPYTYFEAT